LRQAAWAFVARGAQMVQYWHWHTNHFGTETYWIGILPHDQQPGRVYRELSRLGKEFRVAGSRVTELEPDAQVGLLYSTHSKWALIDQAPLSKPGMTGGWVGENMDPQSYHRIFQAFYRGTFDAGMPARIVHDVQLVTPTGERLRDPAEVVAELATLVVAGLLVADDDLLGWLRDYAALGGHLVLGPRTAYGDREGRARTDVKPALLAEAAGVHYQEFSNLVTPLAVIPGAGTLQLAEGSLATAWVDQLISDGATTLAGYDHPHFGHYPAVTTRRHEQGRITTVGTVPDSAMAASLMRWAAPAAESPNWTDLPTSVTVSSATNSEGERIHVVHNWSWTPQQIALHQPMNDVLVTDGPPVEVLDLGPWDVRVLAE
jgi:beta-galactosidase